MSYHPKLLPINPGIVNAITRAAARPVLIVDGCRLLIKVPYRRHGKSYVNAWSNRLHLTTMHAIDYIPGPSPNSIEVFPTREPDYYTIVYDGKLKTMHPRYTTYQHAALALVDISNNPRPELLNVVLTIIAIWK